MTRKSFTHRFTLARPVDDAFPLFTPKGEEDWVPGWRPDYFAPPGGETQRDMIFATGEGAERTWWTCLEWRPDEARVRYFRLTPESRAAFVSVSCAPQGDGGTLVEVGYDIQALGPAGETWLAGMTEESFAAMIAGWPEMIEKALPRA